MTSTAQIVNDAIDLVPVGDLTTHPKNVRQGDLGAVIASIQAHGFFGAVVAQRSSKRILAGNHRYMAAVHLGMTEIPVAWVDCDDEQALRILIADNRTSDLATNDEQALADLLVVLADTDRGLDGIGYDDDELAAMLDSLSDDESPKQPPSGRDDPYDEWATIRVRVPVAVVEMWERARERAEDGDVVHDAEPVRNGLALERVLADWLAS